MNRRLSKLLYGILVFSGTATFVPATATDVTIDFSRKLQKFDGWGTSLCWWAVRVGNWPEAKLRSLAAHITNPDTGLGLNIFRYNIGGGENPAHTHMRAGGNVPGYKASATAAYDWSADPNQRAVLRFLLANCPDAIVEAFSNSPPHWMTKSGCASGNSDGSNNLKDDFYDDFATYLVAVVKHFHDSLGITCATLEPLNESEANWWKADGSQEGCHFDRTSQEKIIKEVYNALKTAGLDSIIRISADDANSIDACLANMNAWSEATLSSIGQINTHSYSGSKRAALRARADVLKLPLYQSESGPLNWSGGSVYEAALFMSRRIISDLYEMKAQAWTDWQLMDDAANWQLFTTTWNGGTYSPATNFYARSSFSRFIRPGWNIVTTGNSDIAAAVSPAADSFGIVVLNETTDEKQYAFTLKNFDSAVAEAEIYRTTASDRCILVKRESLAVAALAVTVPAKSLVSLRARKAGGTHVAEALPGGVVNVRNAVGLSVTFDRDGRRLEIRHSGRAGGTLRVYAVDGAAVAAIPLPTASRNIAGISSLASGVYIISLTDSKGRMAQFRGAISH
jgi:O-glycosyl hydrolase